MAMIEAAEASGELEPGRALLEPTSGNTGISLAMVAKLKGYPLTCVMPANATEERRRLLRIYGAEIVDSPAAEGSNGAVRLALELAERDPRLFMPFQYANEANPRAHYEGTGAEIAEALDRVDVLVAGLGTGGTLMGDGERLRETFPDVVVAAAEPLPGDPVMGLRSLEDGYVPPILDVSKLDRKLLVSNEESLAGVRALVEQRGDLRRRVVRGGRPRRPAARRRAGRGRRRLRPRRRRLEVPLRRLLGRRAIPGERWSTATGGSARRAAPGARGARCRRGARTRPAACSRSATASRSGTSRASTPRRSPYRFDLRVPDPAAGLRAGGRGLRARRLPLAPDRLGEAVPHRHRQHRALGGPAVPDPLAADRRAGRVEDRGGSGSSRSRWNESAA